MRWDRGFEYPLLQRGVLCEPLFNTRQLSKAFASSTLRTTRRARPAPTLVGLRRSFSADLPVSRSQVHLTSLAVNGLPSCHLTPGRNGRVSSVPSSFHDQPVARSGTIDAMLFFATSSRYMPRF